MRNPYRLDLMQGQDPMLGGERCVEACVLSAEKLVSPNVAHSEKSNSTKGHLSILRARKKTANQRRPFPACHRRHRYQVSTALRT